ncbi:MAG: cyclic nucleotide-binding domain-containing protein [Fibrobacteraceae bacterium]|nr:cyclic nucleotide-binding domain-containing protein [Fibrobacteraceae bacterium]
MKAGFVVYSPEKKNRSIVILDEGELVAVEKSDGLKKTVFRMHPGDLVGVAALLEREPFKYTLEATRESKITLVNEECMESELKTLPVWLLAVIKALSSKTRKLKEAVFKARVQDTLCSLAQFLSLSTAEEKKSTHKAHSLTYRRSTDEKIKKIKLRDILDEFHWQTKIPTSVIQEDLKALARRRFIEFEKQGDDTWVKVLDGFLLDIFVDYQKAQSENRPWAPFKLSLQQKKILVTLSIISNEQKAESPVWLSHLQKKFPQADVGEWIAMQNLGWFKEGPKGQFSVNSDKVNYFLTALRYETNLKGVL